MDLWLGIDLGTTGVRCVVYNDDLEPLASSYHESPPSFLLQGLVEQDAEEWWETTVSVIGEALENQPRDRVRGIGISSQGISTVALDETNAPLGPALSWLDSRGQSSLSWLARQIPASVIEDRTGKPFKASYSLPRLAWMRMNQPEVLDRSSKIVMPMDFLIGRLTGSFITDHTMASGSMYYNLLARDWDTRILGLVDVSASQLPQIRDAGSSAGTLLPEVAERLGLIPSVIVAVGAQDQKCAAFGANVSETVVTISLGTAAALSILVPSREDYAFGGIPEFSAISPSYRVREIPVQTAGAAIRWFANIIDDHDYAGLDEQAAGQYPSEDGPYFIPHLSETNVNGEADTTPPLGVFWGLGLEHTRGDMMRAILEGVTFEIADAFHQLVSQGLERVEKIRVFGGGARSELWAQMIADTLCLPVETLKDSEMAAVGAARLAQMACGLDISYSPQPEAEVVPQSKSPMPAKLQRYQALVKHVHDASSEVGGHTVSSLTADLSTWGIPEDATVLIHSSMKSIGEVDGRADTVCEALSRYFAPGLLVLPTHTWKTVNKDGDVFDVRTSPSCVGILPEVFRSSEGVVRSLHPTHSVAAKGEAAESFTMGEERTTTPCSREGVYGRLLDRNSYLVFLGAPMTTNTYVHGVEEWNGVPDRLTEIPTKLAVRTDDGRLIPVPQNGHKSSYGDVSANYGKLQKPLSELGMIREARFGDATVLITTARGVYELTSHLLSQDQNLFSVPDPVPDRMLDGFEPSQETVLT